MEQEAEWRQLGAVVSGIMAGLSERRLHQQRFAAQSQAEIKMKAARGMSRALPAQLELPLISPCAAPLSQIRRMGETRHDRV